MKTTQWIFMVVVLWAFLLVLGCSPSPPSEPESPPTYSQGDVVYHKAGGGKCVIIKGYGDSWKVRSIDGLGDYQYDYFYEAELSSEPPIPNVGLED